MRALILNGALGDDIGMETANRMVEEILVKDGYEVASVLLKDKEIGECLGCFGCWVKTPGICVIDDYGRVIDETMINSDVVVWMTPVVYGGYSSELKKAVDRIIPLLLPFFTKVQGEVHHKKRYKKYPKLIVLGLIRNKDEEMIDTFNSLIKRNELNWHNSVSGKVILEGSEQDMILQLQGQFRAMEVGVC